MLQARLQISDQKQMSYSRSNIEHILCIDSESFSFRVARQTYFVEYCVQQLEIRLLH